MQTRKERTIGSLYFFLSPLSTRSNPLKLNWSLWSFCFSSPPSALFSPPQSEAALLLLVSLMQICHFPQLTNFELVLINRVSTCPFPVRIPALSMSNDKFLLLCARILCFMKQQSIATLVCSKKAPRKLIRVQSGEFWFFAATSRLNFAIKSSSSKLPVSFKLNRLPTTRLDSLWAVAGPNGPQPIKAER